MLVYSVCVLLLCCVAGLKNVDKIFEKNEKNQEAVHLQQEKRGTSDLDVITSRFLSSLLPVDAAAVTTLDRGVAQNLTLLVTNSTTGDVTFQDVDYFIDTPAFWPSFFHMKRTSLFCLAFSTPTSVYYNSTVLLQTTLRLLSTWLKYDYGCGGRIGVNPGWWYCQVGSPDALARTILTPAIRSALSSEQVTQALIQLSRAQPPASCPDANCVWLGSNALYRALFTQNETLAGHSIATIFSTMKTWSPPSGGGMQADKSFTMHGPLLYSGGYGMEYVQGIINALLYTEGTQWAMQNNDERISTFTDFLLDGSAAMISYTETDPTGTSPYGTSFWDISSIGREISRVSCQLLKCYNTDQKEIH